MGGLNIETLAAMDGSERFERNRVPPGSDFRGEVPFRIRLVTEEFCA